MSTRFYYDEYDPLAYGRWMARVRSVMRGKPAQKSFQELESALLALPEKRLIAGSICDGKDVCVIGAYALHKRVLAGEEMPDVLVDLRYTHDAGDGNETAELGESLGMTYTLAWTVAELNDDTYASMTPEQRYEAVLTWLRAKFITQP